MIERQAARAGAAMAPPLSPADDALVQRAISALRANDLAQAIALLQRLSPAAAGHPLALRTAAQVLLAQGRNADARRTLEAVTAMMPADPQGWNRLADACEAQGDLAAAETALLEALRLVPGQAAGWINLGLLRIDRQDWSGAREAAMRATALAPGDPRPPQIAGLAARGEGSVDEAVAAFSIAQRLGPSDPVARHNLADALRSADRSEEARALLERQAALPPQSRLLRAHLRADGADFAAAIEDYRAVCRSAPALAEAHSVLARLLPTLGQAAGALAHFEPSLAARPEDRALWREAVATAKDLGDFATVARWSARALALFPGDPGFGLAAALAEARLGDRGRAIDAMRGLARAHPSEAGVHSHLAAQLLAAGEWRQGEASAATATRLDPLDQSGWAWLAIAWRLLGDVREEWLADCERLIMHVDLPFSSAELVRLREVLEALHVTAAHPPDQSPRGGTQTRGNLFDKRTPEIVDLAARIRMAIEQATSRLVPDSAHPFTGRLTGSIRFAGSWSIRLGSAGFHQNHIHHKGWLSSACYISLPPEIGAADPDADHPPGALIFGVPDAATGLDLAPRRVVRPREGSLALFPSYFWHGTAPFESGTHRLTVAFDAVPARAATNGGFALP